MVVTVTIVPIHIKNILKVDGGNRFYEPKVKLEDKVCLSVCSSRKVGMFIFI